MNHNNFNEHRKQLNDKVFQEKLKNLLLDIRETDQPIGGIEMLSFVIDQVLAGNDLDQVLSQILDSETNIASVKQTIQEIIDLYEPDQSLMEGFVAPSNTAMSFLRLDEEPKVNEPVPFSAPKWRIEIHQTLENLQKLFTPRQLAYRDPLDVFGSEWFTLFRKQVLIENKAVEVALNAKVSDIEAENLEVILYAFLIQKSEINSPPDFLTATLTWGGYKQEISLDLNATNPFPPIKFSSFLDNNFENVNADLTMTIQSGAI
ncbi:hypothetical protein KQH40_01280 [bacterium]|nr:hypothetical protein [bacterium]